MTALKHRWRPTPFSGATKPRHSEEYSGVIPSAGVTGRLRPLWIRTATTRKNQGVDANIVVARIKPVPGQGVVRTNLFIPSKDVWAPSVELPPFDNGHLLPYDNNVGDDRGFSPSVGPEESRVAIYTDFEKNGIIVARQNPSVNADTGEVRAGTPRHLGSPTVKRCCTAALQRRRSVLSRWRGAGESHPIQRQRHTGHQPKR